LTQASCDKGNHIGEIYAQTLFDLAGSESIIDVVKSDVESILGVALQEDDFMKFMISPYFPTDYKKDVAAKMFSGRLNELTMNFLMVVIKNGRMKYLSSILQRYNCLWEESHGYCPVNVTVSQQLNGIEIEKLSADISSAINKKVRLDVYVDPSVLGGIIIRCGEKHIDNTVRTRLSLMVRTITDRSQRREEN